MARLFVLLGTLLTLAACSSGVSNSGAGAAGTNCNLGELNMACTAQVSTPNPIFACAASGEEGAEPEAAATTDFANFSVTISDPLGEFSNTFQGVTFETYDVSFDSGQGGAPNLGTRRFTNTLNIQLTNSTGSGTVSIPFLDETAKRQFAEQASCSTIYPYVVTVRATGHDFATNSQVIAVARTNVGIGGTSTPPPAEEENGEEAAAAEE